MWRWWGGIISGVSGSSVTGYRRPSDNIKALGLSARLNTAFVERVNLTLRQGVAGLARRTWATAQAGPSLLGHLDWWRGYYHFV